MVLVQTNYEDYGAGGKWELSHSRSKAAVGAGGGGGRRQALLPVLWGLLLEGAAESRRIKPSPG